MACHPILTPLSGVDFIDFPKRGVRAIYGGMFGPRVDDEGFVGMFLDAIGELKS